MIRTTITTTSGAVYWLDDDGEGNLLVTRNEGRIPLGHFGVAATAPVRRPVSAVHEPIEVGGVVFLDFEDESGETAWIRSTPIRDVVVS